jgi:hypothetical protein
MEQAAPCLGANLYHFAHHMKYDKCQQCIEWFRQTDKELKAAGGMAEE